MLTRRPLTLLCRITALALATLGVLILWAQLVEWWSIGDWNSVSLRYVLNYFGITFQRLPPQNSVIFDVPLSALFVGSAVLIFLLAEIASSHKPKE